MDAYATPNERKVGTNRPRIKHQAAAIETRTRQERQKDKETVAAERRRIKKAARQRLQRDLQDDIKNLAG